VDQASSGENLSYYSGAGWTGGADQYAEVLLNFLESGRDGGPAVRVSGTAEANANAYIFDINDTDAAISLPSSSFSVALYKQVAGTFTQIGSSVTGVSIAVNDVIRLEVQGTTLRGKINGVQVITGTDGALASGNPGLYIGSGFTWLYGNGTDGWAAGDFSGAGVTVAQLAGIFSMQQSCSMTGLVWQ
jgi:pectate lyase